MIVLLNEEQPNRNLCSICKKDDRLELRPEYRPGYDSEVWCYRCNNFVRMTNAY